jgi:hypothetical protein
MVGHRTGPASSGQRAKLAIDHGNAMQIVMAMRFK